MKRFELPERKKHDTNAATFVITPKAGLIRFSWCRKKLRLVTKLIEIGSPTVTIANVEFRF